MKFKYFAMAALVFGSLAFVSCGDDKNESGDNGNASATLTPNASATLTPFDEYMEFMERLTHESEAFAQRFEDLDPDDISAFDALLVEYKEWEENGLKEMQERQNTVGKYMESLSEDDRNKLGEQNESRINSLGQRAIAEERSINSIVVGMEDASEEYLDDYTEMYEDAMDEYMEEYNEEVNAAMEQYNSAMEAYGGGM